MPDLQNGVQNRDPTHELSIQTRLQLAGLQEYMLALRKIKNRKATDLHEVSPEERKTSKFDDILLRYCNAVYNQNTIERWTKCMLPFSRKGDREIVKDYRGITLTSIAAKIYSVLLSNHIEQEIDKILCKNQNEILAFSFHS